jgi:HEAT repeat protein
MDEWNGSTRGALLDLLKNGEPTVRAAGAQAFGTAGIKARAAVPALAEMILDKDQPPYVVASGSWALGEIGEPSEQALAALNAVGQRKDADESLKQVAIQALDQIRKLKR